MKDEHRVEVLKLREAGHTIAEISQMLKRSTTWVSLACDPEAYARHKQRSREWYRANSKSVLEKRKSAKQAVEEEVIP
jgi:hypothetical protein